MTKKELETLSIADLKALAKKKKVALPAGARKAKFVSALAAEKKPPAAKKAVRTAAAKPASPRDKAASKTGKAATAPEKVRTAAAPARGTATRRVLEREWQMPPGREEPIQAQERVADAKFYTGNPEARPAAHYESLPHEYGQERLVLLARDPHTVFAFWEVSQQRLEEERRRRGGDSRLCVRVYDVTGVNFNGGNEVAYFDQEVYERVGSWYFDLGRAGRSFCADFGIRSAAGDFQILFRSNTVSMPREGFSDVLDEEWMIPEEEFLRLYGIPGQTLGGISSAQARELVRKRRFRQLAAGISSPGMAGKFKEAAKRK